MKTGRLARSLLGGGLTAVLSVSPLGAANDLPLIHAVRNQDLAAARALVAAGADVNLRQLDGATALHWAVHWEDRDTTALLIRAGANVDAANDLGVTPLLMACTSGNAALVETLLQAGANPQDALSSGETALMLASRAGTTQVVEDLLARGADVNAVERTRSQSALMWAIANKHPGVTKTLLDHGANINARSQVRVRVFSMGGSRGAGSASSGIVLTEIPLGGSTPLLFAARSGDVESAKLLVAAGADVRDVVADGTTALIMAAHSGHGTLAAYLLDQGADVNAAPHGYTALHAAVLRGTLRDRGVQNTDPGAGVPLVTTLLAHGADPNVQFTSGTPVRRWSHDFALMDRWVGATPYWLAAKFLEIDIMDVLAEAGADTLRPSRDGSTPLLVAAGVGYRRGGNSAFVTDRRDFSSYNSVASAEEGTKIPQAEERLALATVTHAIEHGATIDATSGGGDTALHGAASHGMDTVVRYLAEQGADINAQNRRGQTPLDVAVYSEGIGRETFPRESTAALLRSLGGTEGSSTLGGRR